MTEEQKVQQAFRLLEVIVAGYASNAGGLASLSMDAWVRAFDNCYQGVEAISKHLNKPNNLETTKLG